MITKKKLNYDINIFGLGYVGLTLAAKLLEKGIKVNGYEIDDKILTSININKKAHFTEPRIDEILKKSIEKKNFLVRRKLETKIKKKSINIITIGTPIIDNKIFLKPIHGVINEIKRNLENDKSIIVLRSTVKVGTTRKLLNLFKKKIHFSFCPERTIEGAALLELSSNPQIIASEDNYTRNVIKNFFSIFNKNILQVDRFEIGELIKLFDNTYRDINFSIGNEFGRICNSLGLNGKSVIELCNKNYIRTNIPLPGTVGGPCLEKDPYILLESIKIRKNNLILTSRKINENMIDVGLKEIFKYKNINQIKNVCIVGLAFKGRPITNDLRGSLAIKIIRKLRKIKKEIIIHGLDPNIKLDDFNKLKIKKHNKKTKYDVIIIQNNAKFIKKIGIKNFKNVLSKNGLIYDFWGFFPKEPKRYLSYA